MIKINIFSFAFTIMMFAAVNIVNADDGYRLWLKYDLITDGRLLKEYKNLIRASMVKGESATIQAVRNELQMGLQGLLGSTIPTVRNINENGIVLAGSVKNIPFLQDPDLISKVLKVGEEGFVISILNING